MRTPCSSAWGLEQSELTAIEIATGVVRCHGSGSVSESARGIALAVFSSAWRFSLSRRHTGWATAHSGHLLEQQPTAIAQLAQDGQLAAQVDALVLTSPDMDGAEVWGGLALALHATRGPSPASELRAIEAILCADGADGERASIKEIAGQTGISVQTVRRRLKLRLLKPALRDAFGQGHHQRERRLGRRPAAKSAAARA